MILRLCIFLLIISLFGCAPDKVPQPQTIPEEDIISQQTDAEQNDENYDYPTPGAVTVNTDESFVSGAEE